MKHFTDALFEEFSYLLKEDLDTLLRYAPNLQTWEREDILVFLRKDPTWNEAREQGTYVKWILDKLNRNLLDNSHLGHLGDVLKAFHDNKAQLKNKDLGQFKTLQAIDDYLNDDNNYTDLSHRQEVRQAQKARRNVDLAKEADLIYEDADWEVWIPLTYAASCKLGQGTTWCTASTESDRYYNDYTSNGKLYINISKKDPTEKYQFHFKTKSFMDKDDMEIDLPKFFFDNENLYTAVYKNLYKFDLDRVKEIAKKLQANNYTYVYDDTADHATLQIIKYFVKHLIIPDGVTTIKARTFSACSELLDVVIPESVTSIGNFAFYGCTKLTSINLSKSLRKIGDWSFSNCAALTNINIPDSVVTIADGAFASCKNLKTATLGKNVKNIGSKLFQDCTSLNSINIPVSLDYLGSEMFADCTLTDFTIPETITTIKMSAFRNCTSLTTVKIPSSVKVIEGYIFCKCKNLSRIEYLGSKAQWEKIIKDKHWNTFDWNSDNSIKTLPAEIIFQA